MSGNPSRFTLTNFFLEDSTQICVIFSSYKLCLLAEYLKNMQISNNMPIIFLINGILHLFTIDRFKKCDLQYAYVALVFLFRFIDDAPFTLPDIFPAP